MVNRKQILSVLGLILIILMGKSLKKQQDLTFLKSILKVQEIKLDVKERVSYTQIYDNYKLHDYRERKHDGIVEEELQYAILYYDEGKYTYLYQIFKEDGTLLKEVNNLKGIVTISEIMPNLVKVRISAGSYAVTEQFFDIENGNISEIFPEISAIKERRIAYMTIEQEEACLIVRDIFSKEKCYQMVKRDFGNSSAIASRMLQSIDFLSEDMVQIKYYPQNGDELITEIIEL